MKIFRTIHLTSLGLLLGCGSASNFGQVSSSNRRSESLDAKDANSSNTLTKKSQRPEKPIEDNKRLQDCPAIAFHAGMNGCDDDDLAVQEQIDSIPLSETTQDPVPTPTAEKPPENLSIPTPLPPAPTAELPPPKDPNIVEFRIKAGTARQAWNTPADTVIAKVGQKIRIYNDDTVVHRLHTNGAPCPHGQNIPPGASTDCVVSRTYDATVNGPLYDHIVGPSAVFHVRAVE